MSYGYGGRGGGGYGGGGGAGGGGASHLAAIYGSEQDKVNCSFYLKIGACRHGDRCSRKHIKPTFSQTIVLQNMYRNPAHIEGTTSNPHLRPAGAPMPDANPDPGMSSDELQEYFDKFYEDVFCELVKFGNLLELHVCSNLSDHIRGNVYARFDLEEQAERAVRELNSRWYAGRPLFAELSPVTDFQEASCRQNDTGECTRGGFCNFMHIHRPSKKLLHELEHQQRVERRENPDENEAAIEAELAALRGEAPPTASKDGTKANGWRPDNRERELSPRR